LTYSLKIGIVAKLSDHFDVVGANLMLFQKLIKLP